MKPTIGRIVHYRLSATDKEIIDSKRLGGRPLNKVALGDVVPAIVVRSHNNDSNAINGQAFLDGIDTIWLLSVPEGTGPGTWQWPERAQP